MVDQVYVGLFDPTTQKVGCVLLQAVAGCDLPSDMVAAFNEWELAPVSTLRRIRGTRAEWLKAAAASNKVHSTTSGEAPTRAAR